MQSLFLFVATFALASCSTISVEDFYEEPQLPQLVKTSQQHVIRMREQALSSSLEEKAYHFEHLLRKNMDRRIKLVPKLYFKGKPSHLRLDMSALLLSAFAFKYSVLQDDSDKQFISSMLDSMIAADAANGYDGFLPYKVEVVDDRIKILSNDTHENVYAQLFFAYYNILHFVDDIEIHKKVKQHLRLIFKHFVKHDYVLYDHQGKETKYSDLSPTRFTWQHNRQLSLLSLLDFGLYSLDEKEDKELLHEMTETRTRVMKMGYVHDVQKLHMHFWSIELPTHSSSWLNFLKIYTGGSSSKHPLYTHAYQALFQNYQDEGNPFFELVGMYVIPHLSRAELNGKCKEIRKTLAGFPLHLSNYVVINSRDSKIARADGNYIKLKRVEEAAAALPIYRRPLNSYEWKRNPKRLDGNYLSRGKVVFTGIDYLQAYWMLRAFEKQANMSKALQ